jgi:hypothetical protein
MALIAAIALFVGVVAVGNALAGEKVKFRTVAYLVKAEFIPVGDEEGHIVVVWEGKGICSNMEGKKFMEGWLYREVGLADENSKTGTWAGQGYSEYTDPEGDKIYEAWEGKRTRNRINEGTALLVKGTGKWQGIQGKSNWTVYLPADDRWYANEEWDVAWPK